MVEFVHNPEIQSGGPLAAYSFGEQACVERLDAILEAVHFEKHRVVEISGVKIVRIGWRTHSDNEYQHDLDMSPGDRFIVYKIAGGVSNDERLP